MIIKGGDKSKSTLRKAPDIKFSINSNHDIINFNEEFVNFFKKPEGRKCYEILHGKLFSCDFCPTFDVMKNRIPEIRIWDRLKIRFRSIVTPTEDKYVVNEVLIEIKKLE